MLITTMPNNRRNCFWQDCSDNSMVFSTIFLLYPIIIILWLVCALYSIAPGVPLIFVHTVALRWLMVFQMPSLKCLLPYCYGCLFKTLRILDGWCAMAGAKSQSSEDAFVHPGHLLEVPLHYNRVTYVFFGKCIA